MCETAFGQFNFELVLALRPGIAEGSLGCLVEGGVVRWLAGKRSFSLGRAPRFCSDATKGDAGTRDSATGDREHHRCRDKPKFVRRSISQLQLHLLPSHDSLRLPSLVTHVPVP